ncbi:MAG: GGDEF domain-containing protein [Epsilonproteobacteria bacterium]|nr:GGDEF domain-containing protein [Campylobacterota bacterium]
MRSDEPILRDIFEKLVAKISVKEQQAIMNKWISVVFENSYNRTLIIKYIGMVVLFFMVVMGVFIFVNRRLKREIEAKNLIQKRLELISITDELTQLYNRRYYNDTIQKAINSAKREKGYIAFVIFDLDFFKQYNDTYGHQAGDAALVKIAAKLKESLLWADDYAFRLGGEEFGIFFRAHNPQDAFRFVDQIRLSFETLQIEHATSTVSNYLTASFGMVCKEASKVIDAEAL